MKLRRRDPLVCEWTGKGFLVGVPGGGSSLKVSLGVRAILEAAGDPLDLDELVSAVDAGGPEKIQPVVDLLIQHGILVPDETAGSVEQDRSALWKHWGAVTERFHLGARDANYLVGTPERDAVAAAIVAEGEAPAIFKEYPGNPVIMLPRRPLPLRASVDDVFAARRTHRMFTGEPVSLDQLATLLFHTFAPQRFLDGALFGVQQGRVSASAGGRHEVECYLVAYDVEGVAPGLYHYSASRHALELLDARVTRDRVAELSYHQGPSYEGAFTVFTTAVAHRLAYKYRHPRAYRLWMYDAGHYGQTYALTCTALGLGPFQTIAFRDSEVERLLGVDPDEEFAVYLLSAGIPAGGDPLLPAGFRTPEPGIVR
ncbi:SagB/ThcOx family dehydrogenase [Amycolatopsis anabasis]|uniref:SagB/ThcOx family dehydrogenase n=1 Tax=Amycolatopsis anabasis TaxID=1840409 RepID=UPI00131AE9B2|nr:SagB/ThcOx family dehydrogenase [Amycolatopsis anabasis]